MNTNVNEEGTKHEQQIDAQITAVMQKSTDEEPGQREKILAIGAGIVAAGLGAGLWYAIAALFEIQLGYIAILVGIFVGFGMKLFLKGSNSFPMAFLAGVIALGGLIGGNYLLWQYQIPNWLRENMVEEGYPEDLVQELTDAEIHEEIPFMDYMKADLTEFEDGNAIYTWLFYGLAVYIGFTTVYQPPRKKQKQQTKKSE